MLRNVPGAELFGEGQTKSLTDTLAEAVWRWRGFFIRFSEVDAWRIRA